jgi:hypothetical protein
MKYILTEKQVKSLIINLKNMLLDEKNNKKNFILINKDRNGNK